jgi:hypothetical protein
MKQSKEIERLVDLGSLEGESSSESVYLLPIISIPAN